MHPNADGDREARQVAVSIRDLSVTFKTDDQPIDAVKNLSLDIYRNECLGVVGASGAGKSTIINVIAGFIPASSGVVLVNGSQVSSAGPDRGVVFQTNSLFPWKRVLENVEFGPRMRGVNPEIRRKIASDLLAAVGVAEFSRFYPPQLSIGMQQRVALARAYANDPDILLMDEPFGSLDTQTANDMRSLLWSIRERNPKTIIFVTHNIEEAVMVSDRIVVLSRRPARVKDVFLVDLAYPRILNAETAARYGDLGSRISSLI
jgi:NitT/TauT family transport system ATP-binding protein